MDGVVGNGVLGWGRPFESRPTALRGYVRYQSNTVNYDNSCEFIDKGDPDIGSIFIVLGNWPGETYGGETWPVIVRTNYKTPGSAQLFDVNSEYIIGYGEKDFTSSTEGEGMIEFNIPGRVPLYQPEADSYHHRSLIQQVRRLFQWRNRKYDVARRLRISL